MILDLYLFSIGSIPKSAGSPSLLQSWNSDRTTKQRCLLKPVRSGCARDNTFDCFTRTRPPTGPPPACPPSSFRIKGWTARWTAWVSIGYSACATSWRAAHHYWMTKCEGCHGNAVATTCLSDWLAAGRGVQRKKKQQPWSRNRWSSIPHLELLTANFNARKLMWASCSTWHHRHGGFEDSLFFHPKLSILKMRFARWHQGHLNFAGLSETFIGRCLCRSHRQPCRHWDFNQVQDKEMQ